MEGEIQRCCIAQDEETINVVTQKWNDEPENEQSASFKSGACSISVKCDAVCFLSQLLVSSCGHFCAAVLQPGLFCERRFLSRSGNIPAKVKV